MGAIAGAGLGGGGRGGAGARVNGLAKRQADAVEAPPFRYELLRQAANRDQVTVAANETVAAGTPLTLRVTPRVDGNLRVEQADGHAIVDDKVQSGKPFEATLPAFAPGQVELRVYFAEDGAKKKAVASPAVTLRFRIR